MAVVSPSFESWLSTKLLDLKTDEGVFGSYIKGILEGDETEDEKTEALEAILAGITEDRIGQHVAEILTAWAEWRPAEVNRNDNCPKEDVDVRLARMLESQSLATTSYKHYCTEEERKIKEAILAQYSQMSDQEESGDDCDDHGSAAGSGGGVGSGGCGAGADSGLERNTNAAIIIQAEKERRKKAKLESLRKKEKDKEDREKQKALKEEKKEKRKTQKSERRR